MLLLLEDLRTTSQGYDQRGVPEGRRKKKKNKNKKKKQKKKKKLKKKQKKKNKKNYFESRESLRKGCNYGSCFLFSLISDPKSVENRSKYVSR